MRRLGLGVVILGAAAQGGCLAAYHAAFHHRKQILRDEQSVVRVKLASSAPIDGSETLNCEIAWREEGPVLMASAHRQERRAWDCKRIQEVETKEMCDGETWDTYLFLLTVGLPFLLAEYLTIVPYLLDSVYEAQHANAYERTFTARSDVAGGTFRREEVVEEALRRVSIRADLEDGAEARTLGGEEGGGVAIPLRGLYRRPTRAPVLRARADLPNRTLDASVVPTDPERLWAELQGADWSSAKDLTPGRSEGNAFWSYDPKTDSLTVKAVLRNTGSRALHRVAVRLRSPWADADGWTFRVGTLAPDASAERAFEIPVGEDCVKAGFEVSVCFSEEHGAAPEAINLVVQQDPK